jgi:2-polyprenyl-6-methoxyphenol hydroxylase-like FAD-dependent oxidoreductase
MAPARSTWWSGRVTLLGDAAFCVSLLGGQGSALAMSAACILAGELHRAEGRHQDAFARSAAVRAVRLEKTARRPALCRRVRPEVENLDVPA